MDDPVTDRMLQEGLEAGSSTRYSIDSCFLIGNMLVLSQLTHFAGVVERFLYYMW